MSEFKNKIDAVQPMTLFCIWWIIWMQLHEYLKLNAIPRLAMGVGHSMVGYGLAKAYYIQIYPIGLYHNWKYFFSKWLIQSFKVGYN